VVRARQVLVAMASVGGVATILLLGAAGPAAASVDGGCTGSASFPALGGRTYDAADTGVLIVPVEDTVTYLGTVPVPEGTERAHDGQIALDLPWPIPDPVIADWGTDSTEAAEDSGSYDYEIPDVAPRGVELRLYGEHNDNVSCTGEVTVKIEGGVGDAPAAAAIAVAGTVAAGIGFALAVRGRPV
jgi:hypothetical protein